MLGLIARDQADRPAAEYTSDKYHKGIHRLEQVTLSTKGCLFDQFCRRVAKLLPERI